jgi:protease-4
MRFLVPTLIALACLLPQAPAQEKKKASAEPDKRVVHELKLSGQYKDLPTRELSATALLTGGGAPPRAFYDLVENLEAANDNGEILVDLSATDFSMNLAQLAEMERVMDGLRSRGIKTTAYLEMGGLPHYIMASLCDRVVMADAGMIDFGTPALGVLFLKDAMDLLGIQFQIARSGRFKGAVEPYVRSSMSEHLRAHYLEMIKSLNHKIVATVCHRRGLTPERVESLQSRRLITPALALESGLVDVLMPWHGARRAMGDHKDLEFKAMVKKKKGGFNLLAMLSSSGSKSYRGPRKPSIVVLHLSGVIQDGKSQSSGNIVSGPTVELIRELADDEKVEGVVVRVNSPGGSGMASEAIVLALRELQKKKPVVVSMGELAASGGYYVAMVGCPVLAEHDTITGSIGVFGMWPNMAALSRRIGLKNEIVSLNDAATMADIFSPKTDDQLETLQTMVDEFYDRFLQRVLECRSMKKERLLELAGGRVWTGAQALEAGLVDRIGGLKDAVALLTEKIGKTEDKLPLAHFPKVSNNPFEMLENLLGAMVRENSMGLQLAQAAGFDLQVPLAIIRSTLENSSNPGIWMVHPTELRF